MISVLETAAFVLAKSVHYLLGGVHLQDVSLHFRRRDLGSLLECLDELVLFLLVHLSREVVLQHLNSIVRRHVRQLDNLVNSTGSDQGWVQQLGMIGGHDNHSSRSGDNAIKDVQNTSKTQLVRSTRWSTGFVVVVLVALLLGTAINNRQCYRADNYRNLRLCIAS